MRILILSFALVLAFTATAQAERIGGIPVGEIAPDEVVTPLGGQAASLSSLQASKVLMLVVFRSSCPDCQRETRVLNALYPQLDPAKVSLLAVGVRDTLAVVERFRDRFGVKYPLAIDPDGKLSRPYNIQEVPTYFIVDGQRVVRFVGHEETAAQLKAKLDSLVAR